MLKPSLEDFEPNLTSMGDECNCPVVWTFFSTALLGNLNEDWPFPVLCPLLGFPDLLTFECSTLIASSFRILSSSAGIPSPPLAFLTAAAAKSLQSCPTLCDPRDGSPPGSPIPGILQAGTLEWLAISFSNAWKWKVKVKSLSRVQLLATPWTAAHQAPPSARFSRQECWSGCRCLLRSWQQCFPRPTWLHAPECLVLSERLYYCGYLGR